MFAYTQFVSSANVSAYLNEMNLRLRCSLFNLQRRLQSMSSNGEPIDIRPCLCMCSLSLCLSVCLSIQYINVQLCLCLCLCLSVSLSLSHSLSISLYTVDKYIIM